MNTFDNIEICKASPDDAQFVAWTVLTALDMSEDELSIVEKSCADAKSMYSWRNSLIAKINGESIGCLISYDGADYRNLRKYTWSKLWGGYDSGYIDNIAEETKAGEYYLDSMAILPQYRNHDIGKVLMTEAIAEAKQKGFTRFTLIVDVSKPNLKLYYESIGFEEFGEMEFFGHQYKKMKLDIAAAL